jgi:hypothetical protein
MNALKNMKVTQAKGTKGFLMWMGPNYGYMFRVYAEDNTFKDYSIVHSDLEIEILDEEATLYDDDNGAIKIDNSPATLGY